jgi:hypothetical protein
MFPIFLAFVFLSACLSACLPLSLSPLEYPHRILMSFGGLSFFQESQRRFPRPSHPANHQETVSKQVFTPFHPSGPDLMMLMEKGVLMVELFWTSHPAQTIKSKQNLSNYHKDHIIMTIKVGSSLAMPVNIVLRWKWFVVADAVLIAPLLCLIVNAYRTKVFI